MRVLVVSQYFWPESFRINDVVKSLVAKGIEVDVLTGKPNYPEGEVYPGYRFGGVQEEEWNGARIFRVPLFPRGSRGAWRLALNYLSFVFFGVLLAPWLLRGRRYDAVFSYAGSPITVAVPAIVMAGIKRCPFALWVQDLWPDSLSATGYVRNTYILASVERLVRWIYKHSDSILVQSEAFLAAVRPLAGGQPLKYYPNSVDASFAQPPDPNVELPNVPVLYDGFPVVFAGNVGEAQAVHVMVEAAEYLRAYPDIRFVVFGKGSKWDWMCQEVARRQLTNLHLLGRFGVETMPGLMAQAQALLVSLADRPIFAATVPNKVQAYMAVGRPIIASMNGEGARIVTEAGAGVAVSAENSVALVDAILEIYNMSCEDRRRMGERGRAYFLQHFEHEKLIDELVSHFRELAGEKT